METISKKNKYSLSIIIPYKNTANYLDRLLDSIFSENFYDVQTIVIDDNSKKNVVTLENIKKKYSDKVIFLKQDANKKGAGAARNIGMRYATGNYLLFADADDFFVKGWYEIVKKFFDSDYDIVFFEPTSSSELKQGISTRHIRYKRLVDSYINNANNENEDKLRYEFVVPWSKLIRRELVYTNNINFDEVLYANDNMFSVKCGYCANNIYASNSIIYNVVESADSLTTNKTFDAFYKREIVRSNRYNFVKRAIGWKRFSKLDISVLGFSSMIKIIKSWIARDVKFADVKNLYLLYKSKNVDVFPNVEYIKRNFKRLFRYFVRIDKKY